MRFERYDDMHDALITHGTNDVLAEIEKIVWDPHTSDIEKTHAVQGLLYTWGQMQDAKSDQMYGDPEAHINSPNMRRC